MPLMNSRFFGYEFEIPARILLGECFIGFHSLRKVDCYRTELCVWHFEFALDVVRDIGSGRIRSAQKVVSAFDSVWCSDTGGLKTRTITRARPLWHGIDDFSAAAVSDLQRSSPCCSRLLPPTSEDHTAFGISEIVLLVEAARNRHFLEKPPTRD